MGEHLRKAVLSRYRANPRSVPERRRVEAHLQSCTACTQLLEDMRAVEEGVRDRDSWIGFVDDPRLDELRWLAANVPAEDAEAVRLLAGYAGASAARFAWEDLANDPQFHTGGVVRALCDSANKMCERDPRYSLALAKTATRIAELLPAKRYPAKSLHEWRGEAYKEYANALYRRGQFGKTLEMLDKADAELDQLDHVGICKVAVLYVRACVLYEQDDLAHAGALAEESAAAARHLGDIDRFMRARLLQGEVVYDRNDFAGAASIFEDILRYGERINSSVWIARASMGLGICQVELPHLREARRRLEDAHRRYGQLGLDVEVTRARWALGRLAFVEGARVDGIERVRSAVAELTKFEMLTDSAIATVDLAEMLYVTNRAGEIPRVLDGVVETFTNAGKLTGALSALGYLKEAAAAGNLTKQLAADVRRFLSRVEHQPQLAFLPPPPELTV